jgi:UPF0042 nucleotide-binding protein
MAEFVIVTGMSGAGRSTTAASLEDLGWFVIDNLPPTIIPRVGELVASSGADAQRVALITGRRGAGDVAEMLEAIERLREGAHVVRVLYLDAPDDVLIRRYEGTRRRHPRTAEGVESAIAEERVALDSLRRDADIILDTGELNVNQLRNRITEMFSEQQADELMRTTLMSFGFKHGLPLDVDMVFDVRFLPNPHWIDDLRPLTGLDVAVSEYVLAAEEAARFVDQVEAMLRDLLPAFRREGKAYLTIGIGCTGGHHRSVAISEELSRRLRNEGIAISMFHRDIER